MKIPQKIRIGTRASKLALWQAHHVSSLLQKEYSSLHIEIVQIQTTGDRILDQSLSKIGGKGLFLKEIEKSLLEGEVDLAVHSMKDVPVQMTSKLEITALLAREDPRDVLISAEGKRLDQLLAGSLVGTSSLRRHLQLKTMRPDLRYVDLRGNVDTRLRKLKEGQYKAIVLAAAGLNRLGLCSEITEHLNIIPAVSQGAIGIEIKVDRQDIAALLKPLNDEETALCVRAERAFSRVLEGDCQTPLGCSVCVQKSNKKLVKMRAFLSNLDGGKFILREMEAQRSLAVTAAEALGYDILNQGGREILQEIKAGTSS